MNLNMEYHSLTLSLHDFQFESNTFICFLQDFYIFRFVFPLSRISCLSGRLQRPELTETIPADGGVSSSAGKQAAPDNRVPAETAAHQPDRLGYRPCRTRSESYPLSVVEQDQSPEPDRPQRSGRSEDSGNSFGVSAAAP